MQTTFDTLAPRVSHGGGPGVSVSGALDSVLRFLEIFSQRKVAADILELADTLQATRPETAARMRRAARHSWD